MRTILILMILMTISCSNHKNDTVVPLWNKSDYRNVNLSISAIEIKAHDTILNMNVFKNYKITIVDILTDGFIIKVSVIPKLNINFQSNSDTIKNNYKKILGLIKKIPELNITYHVKISKFGEIKEILDWRDVADTIMHKIILMANKFRFTESEKEIVKKIVGSQFSMEVEVKKALLMNLIDLFEIYNSKLPLDSMYKVKIKYPNPGSDYPISAIETHRIKSKFKDTYEIEVMVDLDENSFDSQRDVFDKYFKKDTIKKRDKPKISITKLYYWNSSSGWVDSMKLFTYSKTDTMEIKINELIRLKK